jgi:hypothetical protein
MAANTYQINRHRYDRALTARSVAVGMADDAERGLRALALDPAVDAAALLARRAKARKLRAEADAAEAEFARISQEIYG